MDQIKVSARVRVSYEGSTGEESTSMLPYVIIGRFHMPMGFGLSLDSSLGVGKKKPSVPGNTDFFEGSLQCGSRLPLGQTSKIERVRAKQKSFI